MDKVRELRMSMYRMMMFYGVVAVLFGLFYATDIFIMKWIFTEYDFIFSILLFTISWLGGILFGCGYASWMTLKLRPNWIHPLGPKDDN